MEKPGWNYWPVVILGLLWNLMGCLNYMGQSNAELVATLPESYQAVILGRPAWATAAFAVSVFGGAVGCILLLLRRKVAVSVLTLALIATAVVFLHTVLVVGLVDQVTISTVMSVAVIAILLWTGRSALTRGWLR